MSSEGYHEPDLPEPTRDMHRAISSLMEELEAVDWYQQRVDATSDEELSRILAHNRDEEVEHAMMVLEWIRRKNPTFAEHARTYLFSEGPLTQVEQAAKAGDVTGDVASESNESEGLGIGSLRGGRGGKR